MNHGLKEYVLENKRVLQIVLVYFLGVQFVLPFIAVFIFAALGVKEMNLFNLLILNVGVDLVALIIVFRLFLKQLKTELSFSWGLALKSGLISLVLIFVSNIIFNTLISYLTGLENSANQDVLQSMVGSSNLLLGIVTIVLAPILEEIVFRGALFRFFRKHMSFIFAGILSGFLFGFVHVLDPLLSGDYIQIVYILLYGAMGVIMARPYEETGSIISSILLHSFYNSIGFLAMLLQ